MRPLNGLLVLDFSTLLPGPMATLMLAEAGAEVVKIERAGAGDDMRAYAPVWGRDSVNFAMLNRGKKSLALDLKKVEDRERLMPLIRKADVVVEQFRPGVMKRLGLDYDAVSAVNPGIVYCSITGFGQTGPKAQVAGHDLNYIGDAGLLALSMGSAAGPVVPPALIADIAGGAYPAVMNILLALEARRRTGRGCALDVAMADNLFSFMYWALGQGLGTGRWPGNGTELVTGGTPRYRIYPTRDGRMIAAAPIEQKFWETFCALIGLPDEWREDGRDPAGTAAAVAGIIAAKDSAHWRGIFDGHDCCATVVATLEEAVSDPHFKARGLFAHGLLNEEGARLPALPVPIDPTFRDSPEAVLSAPGLGRHNPDLLK
jgi:alpha-methylacyl-CoA racemase